MAISSKAYLDEIKNELRKSLCLEAFSSCVVERHSVPEVEVKTTPHAILEPILVKRSAFEYALIEPSINSTRISIKLKSNDDLDELLCHRFCCFMNRRAENFSILRRKGIEGYDLSFLITSDHLESSHPSMLVDFIVCFMEEVAKELAEMKIDINARARLAAESFLLEFA